ncbi:ankyrin repeat domain-containing protein [Legionella quateirensis]|uniref:Ankyrin repeat n=1 Tax=Legionella quateirensis TaxID=45072 RepID=A0A378KQZ3_9GAMM|nr:ankyrin repeat domain-containing protein [Legionella quateirensis]KTD44494.1 Ankyrin repeat protein [Legionella quateirensis]STY16982.1 Ankyrin repeat [Legionella quateirensis]
MSVPGGLLRGIINSFKNARSLSTSSVSAGNIWEYSRLRNSTNYLNNIALPNNKEVELTRTPTWIIRFNNLLFRSPLKELVFAYHPEGYLSSLVYPRPLVSRQVYSHFKGKGPHFIFFDRSVDASPRLGVTKDLHHAEELAQARRFIETIDSLAPFSSAERSLFELMLHPTPENLQKINEIESDKAKDRPYFGSSNALAFGGAIQQYDERYDRIVPVDIPEIHRAILDVNEEEVRQLLEHDPHLANFKDPKGMAAHELAAHLGVLSIEKLCYEARQHEGVMTGKMDFNQQKKYEFILKVAERDGILQLPWIEQVRQISYSMIICIPRKVLVDPMAHYLALRVQYLTEVEHALKHPRSLIHQSCIDGNLFVVQSELQKNPELLERKDPFGFSPLLLAMANGHAAITEYLIGQGASLNNYSHDYGNGSLYFRPIDNAKTPEIMEMLLYRGVSLDEVNSRLADAVRMNDFAMVRIILFYLKTLPENKVGLTPFDLAVTWAKPNDLRILEFFLKYWTWHVPDGPYDKERFPEVPTDPVVTPEMEDLFAAHNKRLDARAQRKRVGQTVIAKPTFSFDNAVIETPIVLEGQKYRSIIKPAHLLTQDELAELINKPDIFKFLGGEKARNQADYFNAMLLPQQTDADRQFYVDIWKSEDNSITNFFAFDVERITHPKYGDLILFHGKLACNFSPIGIADLNFHRISLSLAENNPEAQVFVFFRAIPPGYGMSYVPPGMTFYPKNHLSEDLVTSIFATKGIKIQQRVVGTDVNAKTLPPFFQLPQEYHRYLTGGASDKAVPVCYRLGSDNVHLVYAKLASYGFSDNNHFAQCWDELESLELAVHPQRRVN